MAHAEGATDLEIATYWGTPPFLRALEYQIQQYLKFEAFKEALQAAVTDGATMEEASAIAGQVIHRAFPNFGVPDDSLGDAAPLPNELTNRVRNLTENPTQGTYNSYIRMMIRTDQLSEFEPARPRSK